MDNRLQEKGIELIDFYLAKKELELEAEPA